MFGKTDSWAFQKNNHKQELDIYLHDSFLKCPKIFFSSNPKSNFNGTTAKIGSTSAQNNLNPPSKVNIGSDRVIFLNNFYFLNFQKCWENRIFFNNVF